MDFLRWISFLILLCVAFKHLGWAATGILVIFFIELESILFILRKNSILGRKSKIIAEKKITREVLNNLEFSDAPVSLGEAILLSKINTGDMEALNTFLSLRCLDKSFVFADVPLEMLVPLTEKLTQDINNNMQGSSEEINTLFDLTKKQMVH